MIIHMRVWPGILINGVLGLKCGAICLLVLAMTVWRAAGQPPPNGPRSDLTAVTNELQALCTQVQETERGELEILKNHQSPALLSALQSEAEFWHFVTDPTTPYLDRRAAATQGGNLIGVEQLPQLWKAVAEFQHLSVGVNPRHAIF